MPKNNDYVDSFLYGLPLYSIPFYKKGDFMDWKHDLKGWDALLSTVTTLPTQFPKVDCYESENSLLVQFALPDCDRESIKIEFLKKDNKVGVRVHGNTVASDNVKKWHLREFNNGKFDRTYFLPIQELSDPTVFWDDGVLTVEFPMKNSDFVKELKIKV